MARSSPKRGQVDATAAEAPEAAAEPSFEQALESLERLVDELEGGDLPLEAALRAFEQGVRLSRACEAQLAAAERRIEALVSEDGEWVERPFEEDEDA